LFPSTAIAFLLIRLIRAIRGFPSSRLCVRHSEF
jgi:hypothetical protein